MPALGHRAQRRVGEAEHGGDQHLQHCDLVVDRVVEEALLEAEARVVDQEVDRSVPVGHPMLDPGQVVRVHQVGPQHLDLDAFGGAELGGDQGQAGLVTGDQHQVVALSGELAGELQPDPRGRPGDESRRTGGRGGSDGAGGVAENMRPAFRCRRVRGNRVGHDGPR